MSIFDLIDDNIDNTASGAAPAATMIDCEKCRATGRWVSPSGFSGGACFACSGTGQRAVRVFKTSAEQRAANRAKVAARKEAKAAAEAAGKLAAFAAAHPARAGWLTTKADAGDTFALSLKAGLVKFGTLTENQMAAIDRAIARDAERAAAGPRVGVDVSLEKIEAAFERARQRGLKARKIQIGDLTFKPAGATSANPGAIYVTETDGGTYLGKVLGGKLFASRDCDDEARSEIVRVCADPLTAAVEYGKATGQCAICSRELTDPESIERGIGPICANGYF